MFVKLPEENTSESKTSLATTVHGVLFTSLVLSRGYRTRSCRARTGYAPFSKLSLCQCESKIASKACTNGSCSMCDVTDEKKFRETSPHPLRPPKRKGPLWPLYCHSCLFHKNSHLLKNLLKPLLGEIKI